MPAKRDNPDDRWYAIVGRFETRIPLQTAIAGGGRIMGYGFGHLNAAPAQLIADQEHRHEFRAKWHPARRAIPGLRPLALPATLHLK